MGKISPCGCATGEVARSNDHRTDTSQNKMHEIYLTGGQRLPASGMVVTGLLRLPGVSEAQMGLDPERPIGRKLKGIRRIPGIAV